MGTLLFGLYRQLVQGVPWGDTETSDGALIAIAAVVTALMTALTWLIVQARLHVWVDEEGAFVQFRPFHRSPREVELPKVRSVEVHTYRPILVGYGLRVYKGGLAYNVRGNQGALITYESGRTLLIGSQKADDLVAAIEALRSGATDPP